MSGPLDGIRVLDWGIHHNGAAPGYMLGDLGAEVIKIEDPVRGDPNRGVVTLWGQGASLPAGRNRIFESWNRNKKGITLNLKHAKGKEILLRLVEKSDVFITNFRPSVQLQLNADYETLRRRNPKIIYACSTGVGSKGPDADLRAFDPIVQARSGFMWTVGDRDDDEPFQCVGGIFDQVGATNLTYGILAALVARERTGIGQKVETSLLGSAFHLLASQINAQTLMGRSMARHSRVRARNPMSNHFRCKDGKWLMVAEPQSDRYWSIFCRAMEITECEKDARYDGANKRRENYVSLNKIVNEAFLKRDLNEWIERFKELKAGFAYAPVLDFEEAVADPQVLANDYVTEFDHSALGKVKMVGFPVQFSQTPAAIRMEPPEFGQHTEEVLSELVGYSAEELAELRAEGVL